MKQCHVEQTALEVLKTLISTEQPEMIEDAADRQQTTTDAAAYVAFEFAVSFHKEADKRRGQ